MRSEKLKKTEVFGKQGTFAYKNINKTVKDFEQLQGIELTVDNEEALSAYKEDMISGMLLVIMAILVLLVFLEERKKEEII